MRFLAELNLDKAELTNLANYLRYKTMKVCLDAHNGHLGACLGAVELLTGLYFGNIGRINPKDDKDPSRDYIMMRGHTGPLRYPIFNLIGWLQDKELGLYRQFGSRMHGHEDHHHTPGVDVGPNGSLGMLLSYGTGIALRRKHIANDGRVFVFIGDGEEEEGNVAEAARHSATLQLTNLIAILDQNGKQLSDPVANTDTANVEQVWQGYGWHTSTIPDGNSLSAVVNAYNKAIETAARLKKPVLIIAKTVKGLGIEGAEQHFSGYHTISTVKREIVEQAMIKAKQKVDLKLLKKTVLSIRTAGKINSLPVVNGKRSRHWDLSELLPVSTTPSSPNHCQFEYFSRLSEIIQGCGLQNDTYFLTADVTRQDHVEAIGIRDFAHFYNVGIREQHMIAFAHGLSLADSNNRVIINSVDAFSLRAADQLLAAAQGGSNICIIGDVAGLTNGRNGKTHQSSVQPIALRDIPGIKYLEPYDSADMYAAMNQALSNNQGITYIRVHNAEVKESGLINNQVRNLTQYSVLEPNTGQKVSLVILSSGCIIDQAIAAGLNLAKKGIIARVINVVSHSPDSNCLNLIEHGAVPVLTAYNGVPVILEYFLGKLLLMEPGSKIPVTCHKGFDFGTTGDLDSLLKHFKLDHESLSEAGIKIST